MEELKGVCCNPWCKAIFIYKESDMVIIENKTIDKYKHRFKKKSDIVEDSAVEVKLPPKQCSKCRSFNDDLSDGIEWNDFKYEGARFDGTPQEMKYKITTYR